MIRILLVDDQDLIRRGMKALLKSDADLEIVGEANNGEAAVAQVEQLKPDLVLMDVRMPGMDGVAATRIICQRFPHTRVLVLTTFDDQTYVRQALEAGAAGYLLKDTPFEELTQAIRMVHKGYTQLGPGIASKALGGEPAPPAQVDLGDLTPREREILQLIAQGSSNREIAQQLFLSEKTVRNHVSNLLSRLGLRDRTQAAILMHKIE
jgi:DNA-binding NarL/FixJ family response regulator